jgi:hypothetical protein
MAGFLISLLLINLGFEAGGKITWEHPLGADIEDYQSTISWGAEAGVRDVIPGIGFDLGFRKFGVEREIEQDTANRLLRWEGYFIDGSAVFESWPFIAGPLGLRLRTGASFVPWRMLANDEVVEIIPEDTLADTLYMEGNNVGVLLGASIMFRPVEFLIIDLGVNHRHVFSMNADFGSDDADERFMEVYLGARFRFR